MAGKTPAMTVTAGFIQGRVGHNACVDRNIPDPPDCLAGFRAIAAATPLGDHAKGAERAVWNLTLPNYGG